MQSVLLVYIQYGETLEGISIQSSMTRKELISKCLKLFNIQSNLIKDFVLFNPAMNRYVEAFVDVKNNQILILLNKTSSILWKEKVRTWSFILKLL